jgi:hypothetical protein
MVPGDDRYERLKHQSLFLQARGLNSLEMEELTRQLWLLERLSGGDATKLDSHLVDRLHGQLERSTVDQLKTTGLVNEWLESWEARNEAAVVPTEESSAVASPPTPGPRSASPTDEDADIRAGEELKASIEHRLRLLLAERVAGVREADERT